MSVRAVAQPLTTVAPAVLPNIPIGEAAALIALNNTNGTGLTAFLESSPDGGTTWFDCIGYRVKDQTVDSNGSAGFSVTDAIKRAWIVPLYGMNTVRLRASALTPGAGVTATLISLTPQQMALLPAPAALSQFTGPVTSNSPTSGIGYAAGAGGTVTQITSRATGVTINKITGTITTDTTSLAAGAEAEFTVTNSAVGANDVVVVSLASGNTGVGTCIPQVTAVAAGSFKICITNESAATAEIGACVLNFAIIKGVAA